MLHSSTLPHQLVLAHVSDTEPSSINLALENPQACRVLVARDVGEPRMEKMHFGSCELRNSLDDRFFFSESC